MKKTSDNRPNCCELLQKINEFSVDKSLLTEDNKTYEEFKTFLVKQQNDFLKLFYYHLHNDEYQLKQNQEIKRSFVEIIELLVYQHTYEDTMRLNLNELWQNTEVSTEACEIFLSYNGLDSSIKYLKVCLYFPHIKR